MTKIQKAALVTGYMMGSAALILVFANKYNVAVDDLMVLACLNIGVWELVFMVDEWYDTHKGDQILFTVIGLLGSGRVNGQNQSQLKEGI